MKKKFKSMIDTPKYSMQYLYTKYNICNKVSLPIFEQLIKEGLIKFGVDYKIEFRQWTKKRTINKKCVDLIMERVKLHKKEKEL